MSPKLIKVLPMRSDIKHGVWGLILGASFTMIIGFAWGGWITRGSSQEMTDSATEAAVLTTRAAICVAQFTKAPNFEARLKELEAIKSWDRPAIIEKGGWDKMPGEETAIFTVSRACADGLAVLMDK
jgi:hypothetical protein